MEAEARSLTKIKKSSGPRTDSCETPDFTGAGPDVSLSTTTFGFFLQEMTYPSMQITIDSAASNFLRSCLWATVSKTLPNPEKACSLGRCHSPLSQGYGMSL